MPPPGTPLRLHDGGLIFSEHWAYDFFEKDGRYYLCVPCGTVAVYDVTVELTPNEFTAYEAGGEEAIRSLADQIRFSPSSYQQRHVRGMYP